MGNVVRKDPRHLMRYLTHKSGVTPEEIARREHVNIRQVKESIAKIEAYEHQNSAGQLQLAVADLVISTMPYAKEAIQGLLGATTIVTVPDAKTGLMKSVTVEDKTTRLEAVRVFTGMVAATQPKTPMVAIQNNTSAQVTASSSETFEERMKRLRSGHANQNLLPHESVGVPEYIDQESEDGPDASDDDEDEEED